MPDEDLLCDICNSIAPVFAYIGEPFAHGISDRITVVSDDGFLVCADCAGAFAAGNIDAMVERAKTMPHLRGHPLAPELEEWLREFYRLTLENLAPIGSENPRKL